MSELFLITTARKTPMPKDCEFDRGDRVSVCGDNKHTYKIVGPSYEAGWLFIERTGSREPTRFKEVTPTELTYIRTP